MGIIYLFLGICMEAVGSYCLKVSEGFTIIIPAAICIAGYILCNLFIAKSLKSLKMSVVYATWYGAGVAIGAVYSLVLFNETLSLTAKAGIVVVIAGIIITNLGDGIGGT